MKDYYPRRRLSKGRTHYQLLTSCSHATWTRYVRPRPRPGLQNNNLIPKKVRQHATNATVAYFTIRSIRARGNFYLVSSTITHHCLDVSTISESWPIHQRLRTASSWIYIVSARSWAIRRRCMCLHQGCFRGLYWQKFLTSHLQDWIKIVITFLWIFLMKELRRNLRIDHFTQPRRPYFALQTTFQNTDEGNFHGLCR